MKRRQHHNSPPPKRRKIKKSSTVTNANLGSSSMTHNGRSAGSKITQNRKLGRSRHALFPGIPDELSIVKILPYLGDVETLFLKGAPLVSRSWWIELFPSIRKLHFVNYKLNIKMFQKIGPALINITDLDMGYMTKITDDYMAVIGSLHKLERLKIRKSSKITDLGMKNLQGLTRLKFLKLGNCKGISHVTLMKLSPLKHLECLKLFAFSGMIDAGMKAISNNFLNLYTLDLRGCVKIRDNSLAYLSELGNLTSLTLTHTQITDEGIGQLSCLYDLQHLSLARSKNDNFTGAGLSSIRDLSKLKTIDLSMCRNITDDGIVSLNTLFSLVYIDLSGLSKITDGSLKYLAVLPALKLLDLRDCKKITTAGINHIREDVYIM
eukprot:TRINITY_DN338_c0_g1_i1.p1 TRINITY_DN338_c0_g1~~TRINITY_DN338_c0_g1_i1.p1  ORF type:complete len:379 (-),score=41.85 TRINITY_DN338_c0_g1_i1:30-1166(-)